MTPTTLHAERATRPARAIPAAPEPAPPDTVAEAERRATAAERDLAYLAQDISRSTRAAKLRLDALEHELARVSGENERRGALLREAGWRCERIASRVPAIEQAARAAVARAERERDELEARLHGQLQELADARSASAELAEQRRVHRSVAEQLAGERERLAAFSAQLTVERGAANARARKMHEEAAAAIRMAEERAASALRAACERVRDAAEPAEVERVLRTELEFARHERDELERRLLAQLAVVQGASASREGRLEAELEHLRRDKAALEDRLRGDLEKATDERIELRTRLGVAEHALRDRDRELERERGLADEAVRWASRVERETVFGRQSEDRPAEETPDCDAKPAVAPEISALRRRGPRVRLRRAS